MVKDKPRPTNSKWLLLVICSLLSADLGWSCAVCFGAAGSDLRRGFYWGILLLLLLPLFLILTIGAKIICSARKKNSLIAPSDSSPFSRQESSG